MAETQNIKKAVKAGSDIISFLLRTDMSDTSGSTFLREYLHNLTSDKGIYNKQHLAMQDFAKASVEIDAQSKEVLEIHQRNAAKMKMMESYFDNFIQELGDLQKAHERLREESQELNSLIKQVTEQVTSIQDISEQTNLLSFNASIEAARAGEAGKGFRIIANEVKRLSDTTKGNSQRIGSDMQNLNKKLAQLLEDNNNSTKMILKLRQTAADSKNTVSDVAADSTSSAATTERVVERISANNQNMIVVSTEVEKENIAQVEQIADRAAQNIVQFNDNVSLMLELKELFQYLSVNCATAASETPELKPLD